MKTLEAIHLGVTVTAIIAVVWLAFEVRDLQTEVTVQSRETLQVVDLGPTEERIAALEQLAAASDEWQAGIDARLESWKVSINDWATEVAAILNSPGVSPSGLSDVEKEIDRINQELWHQEQCVRTQATGMTFALNC